MTRDEMDLASRRFRAMGKHVRKRARKLNRRLKPLIRKLAEVRQHLIDGDRT